MKLVLLIFIFTQSALAQIVPVYNYGESSGGIYPSAGVGLGAPVFGAGMGGNGGMYSGGGMYAGGYPGNSSMPSYTSQNGGANIGLYDSSSSSNYSAVRPNANCPFLTVTAKDDQDVFGELQNYFKSFSQKAECSQSNMGAMSGMVSTTQLESMLNVKNANGTKCYSKNIEQISSRNMALYYVDKQMDIDMMSPYAACNASALAMSTTEKITSDTIQKCISSKYESLVETNTQICKEVVAPQMVQDEINKGMVELERTLIQALSQSGPCAPNPQDTFKMAINTFLKVKSLSAVGPWGAMAGFGADMIGSLLDKFFPSDAQKASALLGDILKEDNYEQNACLYFNIQQKMYCNDATPSVNLPGPGCRQIAVGNDFVKLLENVRDIKKVSDTINSSGMSNFSNPMQMNNFATQGGGSFGPSPASMPMSNVDTSKIEEKMDDLTKYAKASEPDIRSRIKTLPKVQQARELEKINRFYNLLDQYQNFDPTAANGSDIGQKALEGLIPLLTSSDSSQKINFEDLILKTTPGLKMDALKQQGIASSIESLLAKDDLSHGKNAEKSRSMAKYNKYKNAMAEMAQSQFKNRLERQFDDFKKQALFTSDKDGGVVNDLATEGMLRNLVRHCSLLQEIYDPNLEGKMPEQCDKLNCGKENRFQWFTPQNGRPNLSIYKNNYCEKNITYKKIEDDFVKELIDPKGAKICGKKISDFFTTSFFK